MTRFFYRCTGCLDVVALAEQLPMSGGLTAAVCGTCDQHLEFMGRTERDRLVTSVTECVCDSRCVSARGPICNCGCHGANHGAGIMGYITRTQDRGPIPVIMPADATRAARLLADYRAYAERFALAKALFSAYCTRKARREFLTGPEFAHYIRLRRAIPELRKAKTHAARMRKVNAVIPMVVGQ